MAGIYTGMSKAQREKGKAGERELAALFREYGFNARRTSQYCGQTAGTYTGGVPPKEPRKVVSNYASGGFFEVV